MFTVLALAPRPPPTVISLTLRRFSVTWRGEASSVRASSRLPCVRRRKPSSFTFSVLLMTWSGLLNDMPASASCVSSLSSVMPSTPASCLIVTSDILFSGQWPGSTRFLLHPFQHRCTRGHDQRGGAFLVHAFDFNQVVHRLVGEIVHRGDLALGQRVGGFLVHAFQRQQLFRRLVFVNVFLDRQRLGQERILGACAQFLDDVLVEAFHREQFAGRHVGDL